VIIFFSFVECFFVSFIEFFAFLFVLENYFKYYNSDVQGLCQEKWDKYFKVAYWEHSQNTYAFWGEEGRKYRKIEYVFCERSHNEKFDEKCWKFAGMSQFL
jgi:hypothetical protein